MTSQSSPKVSIGLPVYNGERFLREALESLLAQTFQDFEVIVSDNASTDATAAIGQEYAARDPRVRYARNETNLGASRNFNRAFELAGGEYFKWAACDDVCAPDFLRRCVDALDQDPGVVLSHPRATHINEQGQPVANHDTGLQTDQLRPQDRFRDLILVKHWCFQVFGVIRAAALRTTSLIGSYAAADRALLAHLGLLGRFYEVPEYLFLRRKHADQLTAVPARYHHLHASWYDPRKKGRTTFPGWRLFFEYLRAVNRSPLRVSERLGCYSHLGRWLRKNRTRLQADVARAVRQSLTPHVQRIAQEEALSNSLRNVR